MNLSTLRTTAFALLVCSRAAIATAQIPGQQVANAAPPGFTISNLTISNYGVAACNDHFSYSVGNQDNPSTTNPAEWVSLKGGSGTQTFDLNFHLNYVCPGPEGWDYTDVYFVVFVDDTEEDYGVLSLGYVNSPVLDRDLSFTVSHNAGENAYYAPGGKRRFEIRIMVGDDPYYPLGGWMENQNHQIAFDAVMVGTEYTSAIGYFDTPQAPLYILRDPPGDASYSSITTTGSSCFGQSYAMTTDASASEWGKIKVGVEGSVGVVVQTDYKIYAEAGVDVTAGRSETGENEYQTCLETTSGFVTTQTGAPDDLFFGSAIRYAYGAGRITSRAADCSVVRTSRFAMTPVGVLSSYHYTESYIREFVIDRLEDSLAVWTPDNPDYRTYSNQLDVWYQTLAMNDWIKANAPAEGDPTAFNGGPGEGYSVTTTTTQSASVEMNVYLDAGLSVEIGAEYGGSGVSAGGEVRLRSEFGNGETSSNTSTNTMEYWLQDDENGDNLSVQVRKDEIFGTYAFSLDESVSATSCPYEGGYQIDQPSLSVGTPGVTHMVVNEATVGQPVTFPLYICNSSTRLRTYNIKVKSGTNTEGGVLVVLGENISSDILGHECEDVPANGCYDVSNLTLTDPNPGDATTDFVVEVYLYSPCDPGIRSTVILEAHFGEGNIGGYCEPSTEFSTSDGDWVDGVQIGTIDNTNSGGADGPSYTDYTALYSTALSRDATATLTITTGPYPGDRYAAWIDYDRDGAFSAAEKLGEFIGSSSESQNITFTVPNGAPLGTTRLRVRCALTFLDLDPCLTYGYGETEDYSVVIDANEPIDCEGITGGTALPGTACDDNDTSTGDDTYTANCACVGQPLDCAGVAGGTSYAGSPCNDGNANTVSDVYDANCVCVGVLVDCEGIAGGTAFPGTACNDGYFTTGGDVYGMDCSCAGLPYDCEGIAGGPSLPGLPCDDGNSLSVNDAYDAMCHCVGVLATDCLGVPGGTAQPGTPCDDNDPGTAGDSFGADCICVGLPPDCTGTPGGAAVPGAPCSDGNVQTTNDVLTVNCDCVGTLTYDCTGELGGSAQPGTPCDDNDANTGNDVYSSFCYCAGEYFDCLGVPGGPVGIGYPCDDGNPATGGDSYGWDCICAGQLLDCNNEPGGPAQVGSPCNDGNEDTTNDVYTAACICAGTLTIDCEGVSGGPAQPGTPCDDGNADTGNDVYNAACGCAGTVIDCANVIGGPLLPGTPCDDNEDCTTGDVFTTDCGCAGTTLPISAVNGDNAVDPGSTSTYYITPVPGATAYTWTLPNGWSSTNTSSFVLVAEASEVAGPAQVCVDASTGACVLTSCITVQVVEGLGVANPGQSADQWFTVQPNPSNGVFQLIPSSDMATTTFTVYDGVGRVVKPAFQLLGKGNFVLDLQEMASGAYYLMAERSGTKRMVQLMLQR